jgi:hypothetical protein
MIHLAHRLNMEHRQDESENLLRGVAERFEDVIKDNHRITHYYHYQIAPTWRFQGRLRDAEVKLGDLLKDYEKSMTSNRKIETMRELAEVMTNTGRQHEAAEWFQKVFLVYVETRDLWTCTRSYNREL